MKTIIDIRPIVANIVNNNYESIDSNILAGIISELNHFADKNNKVNTKKLVDYLYKKLNESVNEQKMLYADCIAYVEYMSGITIDRILNHKTVDLCQRRNHDTCSCYCDGFDTSCENYTSSDEAYIGTCSRFEDDDIEVCSFEEGDPI